MFRSSDFNAFTQPIRYVDDFASLPKIGDALPYFLKEGSLFFCNTNLGTRPITQTLTRSYKQTDTYKPSGLYKFDGTDQTGDNPLYKWTFIGRTSDTLTIAKTQVIDLQTDLNNLNSRIDNLSVFSSKTKSQYSNNILYIGGLNVGNNWLIIKAETNIKYADKDNNNTYIDLNTAWTNINTLTFREVF